MNLTILNETIRLNLIVEQVFKFNPWPANQQSKPWKQPALETFLTSINATPIKFTSVDESKTYTLKVADDTLIIFPDSRMWSKKAMLSRYCRMNGNKMEIWNKPIGGVLNGTIVKNGSSFKYIVNSELEKQHKKLTTKKTDDENRLDDVQSFLDVVGYIPGIGDVADIANAGISFYHGRYIEGLLSVVAVIPFVGSAIAASAKTIFKLVPWDLLAKAGPNQLADLWRKVAENAGLDPKIVSNALHKFAGVLSSTSKFINDKTGYTALCKQIDEMSAFFKKSSSSIDGHVLSGSDRLLTVAKKKAAISAGTKGVASNMRRKIAMLSSLTYEKSAKQFGEIVGETFANVPYTDKAAKSIGKAIDKFGVVSVTERKAKAIISVMEDAYRKTIAQSDEKLAAVLVAKTNGLETYTKKLSDKISSESNQLANDIVTKLNRNNSISALTSDIRNLKSLHGNEYIILKGKGGTPAYHKIKDLQDYAIAQELKKGASISRFPPNADGLIKSLDYLKNTDKSSYKKIVDDTIEDGSADPFFINLLSDPAAKLKASFGLSGNAAGKPSIWFDNYTKLLMASVRDFRKSVDIIYNQLQDYVADVTDGGQKQNSLLLHVVSDARHTKSETIYDKLFAGIKAKAKQNGVDINEYQEVANELDDALGVSAVTNYAADKAGLHTNNIYIPGKSYKVKPKL